jgi:hypothetical protein
LQALVTDHNLAGAMSGAALARYARSRHPHMNIIIMSGRTVDPIPVGTMFLPEALLACAVAGRSPRLKSAGPRSRDREHTLRLQSHRQFLADSGG